MFLTIRQRAVPAFCVALSSLWMAAVYFPLVYSTMFPNREIQHLIGALQGRELPRQELLSFVQNTLDTSGHLTHAVRVAAYYGASAEYKHQQSRTSKDTEYAYLAWFEKRAAATIFVVRLSEVDGTELRFNMRESEPLALARIMVLPPLAFSLSLYWFRRKRSIQQPAYASDSVVGS